MSIRDEGIKGERKARLWLRSKGITEMPQLDWLIKYKGNYYCVEVKVRELFEPPPFWGTGLDVRQVYLRKKLLNDLGIDTILLVFEKGTNNVYHQLLSVLEKGVFITTRNNIRIYPVENFYKDVYKEVRHGQIVH